MAREIILAILQIFGVFFVGGLARRLGYIDERDINRWSRLVIDFLFPLLVFHSITQGFKAERFSELWPLPFIGLGVIVFGALCGIGLRRAMRSDDPDIHKTFHHFCAINNYGYLPIIIIMNLWGTEGLAKLFFLNLGSTVGYWTIGVALLGGMSFRKSLRQILTPTLFALCLALGLCLTGLNSHVPKIVLRICGSAGSASVPCILVLIGASLYPFPAIRNKRDLAYLSFVRLALLPFLTILVLAVLPLPTDVRNVAIIVALMPVSVSSTILTRRYGGSPDFAAKAAVLTTVLSMATIPLALVLLGKLMAP